MLENHYLYRVSLYYNPGDACQHRWREIQVFAESPQGATQTDAAKELLTRFLGWASQNNAWNASMDVQLEVTEVVPTLHFHVNNVRRVDNQWNVDGMPEVSTISPNTVPGGRYIRTNGETEFRRP